MHVCMYECIEINSYAVFWNCYIVNFCLKRNICECSLLMWVFRLSWQVFCWTLAQYGIIICSNFLDERLISIFIVADRIKWMQWIEDSLLLLLKNDAWLSWLDGTQQISFMIHALNSWSVIIYFCTWYNFFSVVT